MSGQRNGSWMSPRMSERSGDRTMTVQLDGWMGGQKHGWTDRKMDGQKYRQMDRQYMDRNMDEWKETWMDRNLERWVMNRVGWMDGCMDRNIDGQMNGNMEE